MDEKGLKISAMEAATFATDDTKIPAISGGRNVALTVAQLRETIAKADWSGTQTQYNALATKDADRWYVVTDSIDGHTVALYRGERLITAEPNMVGQFAEDSTEDDWYWWPDGVKTPLPVDPATKGFSFYYPGMLTKASHLFVGVLHPDSPCRLVSLERMPLMSSVGFGNSVYWMFGNTFECGTFPVLDLRDTINLKNAGNRIVYYVLLNNTTCRHFHFVNTQDVRLWKMVINTVQMRCVTGLDFSSTERATDTPFSSRTAYLEIKNLGKAENATIFDLYSKNLGNDDEWRGSRKALVDTLITNSFDRAAAGYAPATIQLSTYTFGLLTDDEKAVIAAKGYTLTHKE